MQKAVIMDQGIIKGDDSVSYIDGNDLDSVKADDDKKRAIIDANTGGDDGKDDDRASRAMIKALSPKGIKQDRPRPKPPKSPK